MLCIQVHSYFFQNTVTHTHKSSHCVCHSHEIKCSDTNGLVYSGKVSSLVDVIYASPPAVPHAFLFHPVTKGLFDATRPYKGTLCIWNTAYDEILYPCLETQQSICAVMPLGMSFFLQRVNIIIEMVSMTFLLSGKIITIPSLF